MGIYVFRTEVLIEELLRDADTPESSRDFGGDIIPDVINRRRVTAFPFREDPSGRTAYWRDVGTVDAFWEANLELIGISPELNLYDRDWPIWTYQDQVPPAKFVFDDEGAGARRWTPWWPAAASYRAPQCALTAVQQCGRALLFQIEDSVIFPRSTSAGTA